MSRCPLFALLWQVQELSWHLWPRHVANVLQRACAEAQNLLEVESSTILDLVDSKQFLFHPHGVCHSFKHHALPPSLLFPFLLRNFTPTLILMGSQSSAGASRVIRGIDLPCQGLKISPCLIQGLHGQDSLLFEVSMDWNPLIASILMQKCCNVFFTSMAECTQFSTGSTGRRKIKHLTLEASNDP